MKYLRYLKVYNKNSEIDENKLGIYDFDYSKIIICVKNCNISGINLYHLLLEKYKIQVEMASKDYILAMTSICDTEEGFVRLSTALLQIDNELSFNNNMETHHRLLNNTLVLNSYDTFYKESEEILLFESVGRLSKDYIYLYPPGIPLIVPGEMISKEFVEDMIEYKKLGFSLKGIVDEDLEYISVVK
jgi:arginine/lysine/ornithine decarboxylase